MYQCPKCKTRTLTAVQPAPGLVARGCTNCDGLLIDLWNYKAWREHDGALPPVENDSCILQDNDTAHALTCRKCSRIMIKYRVTSQNNNRIDYCVYCSEVWLDTGELSLLNSPGLSGDLGKVFSTPWQRWISKQSISALVEHDLQEQFGDELDKIIQLRHWLNEHPKRREILTFLRKRE